MYPPTAPIKSKIDPLDSFGLEKAESATEKIRELCRPSNSPLHSLRDALAVFDRLESGDLHVREPIMGMSDWHYQFSYLCKEVFFAPWFIGTSAPEVWDHVRSALLKSQNLHEGSLDIRDESRLVVTPGVRRFRSLSETELSEIIFYLQWGSEEWYHTTQAPQFYPCAVAPHLRGEAKDISPLAWTAARAEIVLGYSLDVGSDFAASFIIDIYLRASQYACNLCPESLKNSKEYSLETPANKALLGQLRAAFGAAVAPEFYNLVFEIPGHFSAQVFESKVCKSFVEKLPHLLDQGLVIFRVSELISDCVKAGVSGAEAIDFALNLVTAIYGGKEKPWWFKEDFDLRLGLSTEELSQAKVRRQLLAVAKKGGFATEHIWPLYRGAGRAFAKETKISAKDALGFVAKVCLDYGIENPKRAALVLDFTKAYLLESAAKDRLQDLRKMQETLAYYKPKNEIVALLEGDNVSFKRTGMYPLLQLVAPEWDNEVRAAHELNLTAAEVGEIIRRASGPVKDRSHLIPKLGAVTRAPLLAVYPERQSLELPVGSPPRSATKPLHAWQAIDRQARRECSKENVPETLATYLAVCGPKLEDPFRPPPGFLGLLEKILRIEDPRHRQLIFEHPDAIETTTDRNKEFRIELYQAIGRLLEAHTIGVFSSAEVTAALKWIAADDVKKSAIGDAFRSPKQVAQQQRVLTICTWERQVRLLTPLVAYEIIDKEKAAALLVRPLKGEIDGGDSQSTALGSVKPDYKLILPEELSWLCESEMLDMTQVTEMLKAADSLHELNHVYGVLSAAYTQAFSLQNLRYRSYDAIRKSLINDPSTAELEDTLQSAEKNKLLLREKLQLKFRAEVTRTIRFKLLSGRIDSMLQAAGIGGLPYDPVYRASRTAWSIAALAHSFVVQAQASEQIPQGLSHHPIVAGQGDQKITSDLAQTFAENVETLNHSFGDFIPRAKNFFKSAREESFGLLPVGGKIHVLHKIDAMRLEFVKQRLGLDSTGFRLLHADTSLLLPPMPSAAELKLVVTVLNAEGVIDTEHPELQVCIPGRLPPDLCAILGASILLATEVGVKYDPNSFKTNDDGTGIRIMAYDAGGPREAFPFSTPIGGRTDMLGRRALSDIDNYQLLGTVLVRSKDFGPYGDLAKSYIAEFKQILAKYGLSDVLKTSWVAKNEAKGDFLASQRHYCDAVLPCTNAWFTWFEANKDAEQQSGIVTDVRNLLDSLGERVNMQRIALFNNPEFSDEKRSLLSGLL